MTARSVAVFLLLSSPRLNFRTKLSRSKHPTNSFGYKLSKTRPRVGIRKLVRSDTKTLSLQRHEQVGQVI